MKSLPYANKLIKLAEEPVAYQLYKSRHEQLNELSKPDEIRKDEKRDFRNQLLRTANAKIITSKKIEKLIERNVILTLQFDNKIINLPFDIERKMHQDLLNQFAIKEERQETVKHNFYSHSLNIKKDNCDLSHEKKKEKEKPEVNLDLLSKKEIEEKIYSERCQFRKIYVYEDPRDKLTPV